MGALAGASVVGGWVLHDLAVFLTSGEPGLAARLALPSLALILAGALVGGLAGRGVRALVLASTAALVAVALPLAELELSRAQALSPWALSALALALWLAGRAHCSVGAVGMGRAGLACGLLACIAVHAFGESLEPRSWSLAGAALLGLGFGWVARPLWRRGLTALLIVAAAFPVAQQAAADAGAERPDLEASELRSPAAVGPNLILIVLDTVRADRLRPYGYSRETTPALDAFVKTHAVRYTRARSTSSWTLASHASLFTGLMPAEHGATHSRRDDDLDTVHAAKVPAQRLRPDVPTLAEVLRERGYRTGAVLGNSAYLDHRFGLDRGFEHYDARPGGWVGRYLALAQLAGAPQRDGHLAYREAPTITDLALDWLDAGDERPFFLAVNYMDAHGPYLPPPATERAFEPGGPVDALAQPRPWRGLLYDRELLGLDAHLGRLLARLTALPDFEDTVIVITSDHGEALGDHDWWAHNWTLYEELVHVPLYVKPVTSAGPRRAATIDAPITGADVFRLALAELGIEAGASAPNEMVSEWYLMTGVAESVRQRVGGDLLSWLEGSTKVIVNSKGTIEAFDLERDPGELEPLQLSEARRAAALERARAWWAEHPPPAPSDLDPGDAADLERLRALGYAGGDD